jgi:hypothetical protein
MLDELKRWWQRLWGDSAGPRPSSNGRATPSGPWEPGNGVSSFHLWWQGLEGAAPLVAVAATLEVVRAPTANRLYFWALQASFLDGGRSYGAAHTGLQWNPRHPGSTAINWGGYSDTGNVQSILKGSPSPLPSTPNDPNTRDFPWREGTAYRFRISRADDGWRGEVTDLADDRPQLIRDLYAGGDRLGGFVVWAEVFAACDDPTSVVRWSDFEATDAAGVSHRPNSVRLSFPTGGDCPNTEVVADQQGLLQMTNAERTARNGAVLPIPTV